MLTRKDVGYVILVDIFPVRISSGKRLVVKTKDDPAQGRLKPAFLWKNSKETFCRR